VLLVHCARNPERVLFFIIPGEPTPYLIREPQAATWNPLRALWIPAGVYPERSRRAGM